MSLETSLESAWTKLQNVDHRLYSTPEEVKLLDLIKVTREVDNELASSYYSKYIKWYKGLNHETHR